jgi:2,3-bisphosphoglycerate-independent phosphoglycerate mutase
MTEVEAKKGKIGLIEGAQVVQTALDLIKSQM